MSFSIFFPCAGCDVFNLGEFGEEEGSDTLDIYIDMCVCVGRE
jgi:hypothetical protein